MEISSCAVMTADVSIVNTTNQYVEENKYPKLRTNNQYDLKWEDTLKTNVLVSHQ